MPKIEITDKQREYLDELRADLEADVGPYGHVRVIDALQYLIDANEGDLDDAAASAEAGDGSPSEDGTDGDESNGETGDESDGETGDDAESGGDRLSMMMKLLETHDDKWRESGGDARYEVDLPDGTTEAAPTKDDVRALLFKNY